MKKHITVQNKTEDEIASIFWHNPDLESFELINCSATRLPRLPRTLTGLQIFSCPNLVDIPPLPESLTYLFIHNCPGLTSLPALPGGLITLHIGSCHEIKSLPVLLFPLKSLTIDGCRGLIQWPLIPDSVTTFSVAGCPGFTGAILPSRLEYLSVEDCSRGVELHVGGLRISIR